MRQLVEDDVGEDELPSVEVGEIVICVVCRDHFEKFLNGVS